jgi:predicted alpha/beta hydrolase family esterase
MKTAIIIHGMPSREDYYNPTSPSPSHFSWLPWIQKQFLLKDVVAQTPEMPVPYHPEYSAWKEMFERFSLDEDTILIGHSCGGGFIVRYLSENDVNVGKVVLVAPWIDPDNFLKNGMFDFSIDPNLVSKTKGVTIFSSTNDDEEVQKSIEMLKNEVKNLKVVEFKNMGHFCFEDMKTIEFPELIKEFE